MNFDSTYLMDGLADSELELPHPKNICEVNLFTSVQGVSNYRCVKATFSLLA